MAQEKRISIIAAIGAHDRALGKKDTLLWHLPEDLKRFKGLTNGHPVIMGRKTWESLPERFRPLPGRTNIVITRQSDFDAAGALLAFSLPEALGLAKDTEGSDEIFIIGGGEIYRAALPFADRLYLTLVDEPAEADTFFPAYEEDFPTEIERSSGTDNDIAYTRITLER